MKMCETCKQIRDSNGLKPLPLKRLPTEVVMTGEFKKKSIQILLCEFCDGEAFENAMNAHNKRTTPGTNK